MRWQGFLPLCLAALAAVTRAEAAPTRESGWICHTKNPLECYPKIFVATEEFQVVKDDQDIPKGLHIRLNLETGLKEAKIYHPEPGDESNAVLVSTPEEDDTGASTDSLTKDQIPLLKGLVDGILDQYGDVRPPPSGGPDGGAFKKDLATIRSLPVNKVDDKLLPTLESLEDSSHDAYWGLQLAKDGAVVHKLDAIITDRTRSASSMVKGAAALLLGTAIQNNPAALSAALAHFYNDEHPSGPLEHIMLALVYEQIPTLQARLIYLLSELCQDKTQLARFFRAEGHDLLRVLYDTASSMGDGVGAEGDARDRVRAKIQNFVLDHFLQEDSFSALYGASCSHKDDSTRSPSPATSAAKAAAEDGWELVDLDDLIGADGDSAAESTESVKTCISRNSYALALQPWMKSFMAASAKQHGDDTQAVQELLEPTERALKGFNCRWQQNDCGWRGSSHSGSRWEKASVAQARQGQGEVKSDL